MAEKKERERKRERGRGRQRDRVGVRWGVGERVWEVEEDSKKGTERERGGETDRQRRVSKTKSEDGGRRESGKKGVGEVEA